MESMVEATPLLSAAGVLVGLVALVLCCALFARLGRFARPFDQLVEAAKNKDVGDVLQAQLLGVDKNSRRIDETLAYVRHLRAQAMNAIQGIGFKRYDAFDDIRGQQSFSLCLVDAHMNGVMITSIAGRNDSRAYAKPVRGGKCEMVISEEESQVLELARQSLGDAHEPVLVGV
jgi:hypothetical protein